MCTSGCCLSLGWIFLALPSFIFWLDRILYFMCPALTSHQSLWGTKCLTIPCQTAVVLMVYCWVLNPLRVESFKAPLFSFPKRLLGDLCPLPSNHVCYLWLLCVLRVLCRMEAGAGAASGDRPVGNCPSQALHVGRAHKDRDSLSLAVLWEAWAPFVLLERQTSAYTRIFSMEIQQCSVDAPEQQYLRMWEMRKRASGIVFYVLIKQEADLNFKTCSCVCSSAKGSINCSQKGSAYFCLLASLFITLTPKVSTVWMCEINEFHSESDFLMWEKKNSWIIACCALTCLLTVVS